MDGQMKLILGLLITILVLGGIFGLKFFGSIKSENNGNNLLYVNNSSSINEVTQNNYSNNTINNNTLETPQGNTAKEFNTYFSSNSASKTTLIFIIVLLVLYSFVNIGVAKLYRKLMMPDWTYYYTIFSPVLIIIALIVFRRAPIHAIIAISFVSAIVNALFFSSIDINPMWAFVPTLITGFKYLGSFGNIISIGLAIAFLIIWVKAISKLAEKFGKGEGFKIGLFFLPLIFFPILGFQKD